MRRIALIVVATMVVSACATTPPPRCRPARVGLRFRWDSRARRRRLLRPHLRQCALTEARFLQEWPAQLRRHLRPRRRRQWHPRRRDMQVSAAKKPFL